MKLTTAILLTSTLLLSACQTPARPDQVQSLLHHTQFPAAKAAAPEWARQALTAINDLQRDLAKLKAQTP